MTVVVNYKAVKRSFRMLGTAIGSALIGFIQSGAGAVPRDAQSKMRDTMSVFDFMTSAQRADVLARTKTQDVTVAAQTAMAAAVAAGCELHWPGGTYKITDTLSLASFTNMRGEHRNMNKRAFGTSPLGTVISFEPTSAKSLFVASGAPEFGSFRSSINIDGFHIEGNSTTSTGDSIYAFDIDSIVRSHFGHLAIQGFRTGIRCDATINNRFEFVYVGECYVSDVLYDGGTATTDVWDQCYLNLAPIGVQTNGTSLGIRWKNCTFESLETYGVNLAKEVYGWEFIGCYGEDAPSVNTATNAMFRVGFDGTTLAGAPQLTVIGGEYGGRNAGAVGAFIDVDSTDGVTAGGGLHASRYTNVIRTSSNTLTNQVVLTGFTCASISSLITDVTKVAGVYPSSTYNTANRNEQRGKFAVLYTAEYRANPSNTGTLTFQGTTFNLNVTSFVPASDNALDAGSSSARFANVYGVKFRPGAGTVQWTSGSGSPEGVLSAAVGSLYTRSDGGSGTTLYVKETGAAGNTGWVAK